MQPRLSGMVLHPSFPASLTGVQEAASRISSLISKTPVLTCSTIDSLIHRQIFFKCENFQRGGAFKFRGSCNAVLSLSEEEAAKGVVTHSSGNHAGTLALAAKIRGIPAYIVLPTDTPQVKVDAVTSYGGKVTFCPPTLADRERTCAEIQAQTGATLIPPYNYGPVMCGQGTIALELLEQVPVLDAIIIPVSGGGLLSGIAVAAKALNPNILIIAAEPLGNNNAADVAQSKAAGHIVTGPKVDTIADGLRGNMGSLTWPVIRDLVDDVITVSEQEIVDAMQLLFERMKLVVEPSGAASLAAAMSPQFRENAKWQAANRIAVVLSGGNVDFSSKNFWKLWA